MGSRADAPYGRRRTGPGDCRRLPGEEGGANRENEVLLLKIVHLPLQHIAAAAPSQRCTQRDLRSGPLDAPTCRARGAVARRKRGLAEPAMAERCSQG
jgi:hypothetical protein